MRLLAAGLAVLTGACVAEPSVGDEDVRGSASPIEGTYAVETRVDLSVEMPQIELALATLRTFSQGPGSALLGLSQRANDPALIELYAAISPALRDRLAGWFDVEIDKARIAGKTARQYADAIAVVATTVLSQFTLESTLTFAPTKVTHAFNALNFTPASIDILIPIGGLKADTLTQLTTAAIDDGADTVTLGDQRFGLAFGSHAWQAIGLASTTLYAGDLRSTLANAVACPSLAQAVASRCVEAFCVGHAVQLEALCTRSIDLLVAEAGRQIAAFDLDVLRFVEGNARLVDDNIDGVAERIVDGTWSAETDIGLGVRTSSARFSATRDR